MVVSLQAKVVEMEVEKKSAGRRHAVVEEDLLLLLLHPRPLLLMEEEDQIAQFVAMAMSVVGGRAHQLENLKIVVATCELFVVFKKKQHW